jgi:hypothetical protein
MRFRPYNKYKNKITYIDNIRFASKREAARYQVLKLLEQQGAIKELKLQPTFKFPMGFAYRADFSYLRNNVQMVEDVKGLETDVFKLKSKCFKYFYPAIDLIIIK